MIFSKLFISGSQHVSKRLQKGGFRSGEQNLPTRVDFILIDAEEEVELPAPSCKDAKPSQEYSASYAEVNIPSTFHSDTPLSASCPSSNFLDLRATYPSLPLPMGSSNGPVLCANASFNGYLTTLLVPSIWLVLGTYVFVATMIYILMPRKHDAGPELSINKGDLRTMRETPACDALVPGTAPPTPEEVLEHTLEQYGHLSDSDQDDTISQPSQCPSPPSSRPKPNSLNQKTLKNTVRKDVDIMFRGTVPDSWVTNESHPREIRSAYWATSAPTTTVNTIEANTPMLRIPTPSSMAISTFTQHSGVLNPILPRPIGFGVRNGLGVLPQTIQQHRPALTINTRHLVPVQHQCYSSSPLRYSYTISPPYSPSLRTPATANPVMPINALRKNAWAPSD